MRKTKFLFLSALLLAGVSLNVQAKTDEKASDAEKEESKYEEFLKQKPETHEGFITVHKLKGKVYFEFPLSLLGREMLVGSTVTEISDNGDALIGSKPQDLLHITFRKIGEKMNIVQVSKDYITDSKRPEVKEALDKNSSGAIMKSFDIDSYNNDSTAVVFDVTDFFVSDIKEMRPFDTWSVNTYMGQAKRSPVYESSKSFLGDVKSFSDNLSVTSHLSYTYSITYAGRTLREDVPFTALMTRSFVLLDEVPYRPRPTDSRIGIFPTGKYLFSEKKQETEVVYFANRWRIEPSDVEAYKRGELVEPKKPIVFYIDPAFPVEWKDAIYEAVNQWKEPFERIGFKNAVQARPYPTDDPEFDPDNLKYSCVRYSPVPVQNAMGPSWVDPRSGEVINASVYVYHDIVKLVNNWRYIQTAQTEERVRSGKLPQDLLDDALRYVLTHEVGHCLGLMHNMSSSATIPVDSLRSPSFTQKYGTTHSIMDYARFNYVAQPGDKERGVKLTPPKFGLYDYYAIAYTYTPVFDATLEEEAEIVSGWLTKAQANPIYRYGKQQMSALDPRSQNEDLGDNAMKASEYGIKNLKLILSNLNDWVTEDEDFSYRKDIYEGIIFQYLNYIQHVYSNVGGIYLYEKHVGDPIDYAYQCVPKAIQKEAFQFVCDQIRDLDWLDNTEILKNIQIMGHPSGQFEVALAQAIIAAPFKIAGSEKMAHDEEIYTASECMEDVYDLVWSPTEEGRQLTDLEMLLQREYLRGVCSGAGFAYKGAGAAPNAFASQEASANAYTSGRLITLQTPEVVRDYKARMDLCTGISSFNEQAAKYSDVSGYDSPYVMFVVRDSYDAEFYSYVKKVQKLISRKVKSAKGETKAHYTLLLHNLEQTLK